jgi:hypothetical protein
VLATRHAPETLRTPFHTAINITAIAGSAVMLAMGLWRGPAVLAALSPIGALIGWGGLGFARRPYPTPMAWWYEHMGSMIGGGIAFHTAFLVLGAGRMLGIEIAGPYAIIPWLLPTIVGIPASSIWVRYYRRKFREDGATLTAGAGVVVH